ncbi:MAG: GNAT family N-acetyltransferase [Candidatus Bathyarchaeota archaeon]|nr:MAG: GNAT family N-acetyltransferase [Candidatus Bathyarchaeota archaeon]
MRFFVGNGSQFEEKLQDYPTPWADFLRASRILVVGVVDDNAVAAYGIRSMLNVMTLYVKEGYRGQGIGRQLWEKVYNVARKQRVHFFTGELPFQHLHSKYGLLLFSEYGCRVMKRFDKSKTVLIMCPFTIEGGIFCAFLRIICSMIPAELLRQITDWLSKRTRSKRGC